MLRTLQVTDEAWSRVVEDYARAVPEPSGASVERRLEALREAFCAHVSQASWPADIAKGARCRACGAVGLSAVVARRPGPLIWARCPGCSHGTLLDAGEDVSSVYASDSYYRARDEKGVGYEDYANEATYRQEKGRRLLERVTEVAGRPLRSLLEVGSGYGYTRAAGEQLGFETAGVDLNPHAASEARRNYGLETFSGTLEQALESENSGIEPGRRDLVLYQFVLEHIADLARELRSARRVLEVGGWLCFLVPSFEAVELEVFGGSYRSLRADHLHLFSPSSVRRVLERAGFTARLVETGCNLHLLRGFLSADELRSLYAAGRGPDLVVIAERAS